MKRIFALFLCLILPVALCSGCKKEEDADPGELTETIISGDLLHEANQHSYDNCGTAHSVSDLNITKKFQNGNATILTVTATVLSDYTQFDLSAEMTYVVKDDRWTANDVDITEMVPTSTGGPDPTSTQMAIANYLSVVGSALAVQEEEQHSLSFNVRAANWDMQWEEGSDTATLHVSYTSSALSFTGHYILTFTETGWVFEYQSLEDGYRHILMHLDSLEQKEAADQ